MSPRTTFQSEGNSSKENRRSQRPTIWKTDATTTSRAKAISLNDAPLLGDPIVHDKNRADGRHLNDQANQKQQWKDRRQA